jgi:branched-chain amino acid transport system substrate-binding protein
VTRSIPVGLLFSTSGTEGAIGRDALDGAGIAIDDINAALQGSLRLEPVIADPGDSLTAFHQHAERMLTQEGCRHIIGTVTSSSRKEVIPVIEKHDALLWYTCPYEGFEACENVIYLGSSPAQHIVPLFRYLLPRLGANIYLTGSNYVWGWETNRVARELATACGGTIRGEKYVPLGVTDVDRLIEDIAAKRPDFILNNLIGDSSYAFYRAMHELAQRDPFFSPESCPVVSCNVTEAEIAHIGADALNGHITTSLYLEDGPTPGNADFKKRVAERLSPDRRVSTYLAAGYTAAHLLGQGLIRHGDQDIELIKTMLHAEQFDTPLGTVDIDPSTNHNPAHPLIGKATPEGRFDIIDTAERPVAPDPYFVNFDSAAFAKQLGLERGRGDRLRVVR